LSNGSIKKKKKNLYNGILLIVLYDVRNHVILVLPEAQYHMFYSHKLTYNYFGFSYWQLARHLPGLLKLEATYVTWNWQSICCPSFLYEKFSQLGNILVIFMKMLGADCFGNVETRR